MPASMRWCCLCFKLPRRHRHRSLEDRDLSRTTAKVCAISLKEERARHRLQLLTPSQMHVVMESCGLFPEEDAEQAADMIARVMAWRRERGDLDEEKDEPGLSSPEDLDEIPQLPDDMEGVTMASLDLCFLKTDLQVECLLRSISYEGGDRKAELIAKLMDHKQHVSRNVANSFQVLSEQAS